MTRVAPWRHATDFRPLTRMPHYRFISPYPTSLGSAHRRYATGKISSGLALDIIIQPHPISTYTTGLKLAGAAKVENVTFRWDNVSAITCVASSPAFFWDIFPLNCSKAEVLSTVPDYIDSSHQPRPSLSQRRQVRTTAREYKPIIVPRFARPK